MLIIRAGVERLLLLLLWIARIFFILQGIAFCCASVTAFAAVGGEAPPWVRGAMVRGLLISGTFFVAGLLLMAARRWRVTPTKDGNANVALATRTALSLLVLPAVAALAASGLPPLWRRIAAQLSAIGFWDAVARPDPYGGILLLPIMLALLVPMLLTAAAAFSIGFPLALLPLLAARSRLLPTLLVMGAICQVALVSTGAMAVDVFSRLATQAQAAMAASGDAEVLRVGDQLNWAIGILIRTALALVAPTLGMLAWTVFLRPSGAAAAAYLSVATTPVHGPARAAHAPASVAPPLLMHVGPMAERRGVTRADVSPPRPTPGIAVRAARVGLWALGALMLAFGAADGLRTRASYVGSQPAPGVTLATGPATVRVTFAVRLDSASSLSVIRLAGHPSDGQGPQDVEVASRLAPDDPGRRTIEGASLRLSTGLYRVAWRALPARGGGSRHGSFSFGVGVPVPGDTPSNIHSLSERDMGARRRRQTMFGGLLLLVLSVLLPRGAPRI